MYISDRQSSGARFQRYSGPAQGVSGFFVQGIGDPVADIGQMLWERAPAGVKVAIHSSDAEQTRRGIEWAKREGAIGFKAKKIDAAELIFGKAFADSGNIVSQLMNLRAALKTALDRVQAPRNITPLAGTGPNLIRTLALFTHGTTNWIGIGGGITTTNAATVIKKIAPLLTVDVKIIIYGCSAALGQKERANNWVVNSMEPGGEDSLAAKIRDGLVDAGKVMSSVWSHTEVGHTTRNPSLRFFNAGYGKGAKGGSYAGEFVFGTVERITALREIEQAISGLGFAISNEENFRKLAYKELRELMYKAYVSAVIKIETVGNKKVKLTNLTYGETNLPEVAPLYPLEVAGIIRKHWSTYWSPQRKVETAKELINKLKLKKATTAQVIYQRPQRVQRIV